MKILLPALAGLAFLTVALTVGCSGDRRDESKVLNRVPQAYVREGFTDLPLEVIAGYRLAADQEPLAVSFAGGALRRFDVVYTSTTEEPEPPRQVLDRLAGGMADRGWVRLPAPAKRTEATPDRYRKGDEVMAISAEISSSRTLVTWHLTREPISAPTTP